jgi:hypothetical protein
MATKTKVEKTPAEVNADRGEVKNESAEPKVVEKNVKKIILKTTSGKEVSEADYFFGGKIPSGFEGTCGKPVDREDLLEVFNKVFKPEDNFLFYKAIDKEVYIIIPPIKYSTTIGDFNNSLEGDFQKHAISFLNEGSVNLDTLKIKLNRILPFCKFKDR